MKQATKKCSHCQKHLPTNNFHKNSNNKDGLQAYCKSCNKKIVKEKYHNDTKYRESILLKQRENWRTPSKKERKREIDNKALKKYALYNRDKINVIAHVRFLNKKNGTLEKIWERANGKCELCKKEVTKTKGGYAIHHVDKNRKNNSLENLILVCTFCHLHKLHK